MDKTRNSETLADFVAYCKAHPTERFWQALRNWSENNFVFVSAGNPDIPGLEDTFYREGKD